MSTPQLLHRAIRSGLAELADPRRAPQMQAYLKSALPFYGVPRPAARKVFRAAIEAHPLPSWQEWHDAIRLLWDGASHREEWYAALAVASHRRYAEFRDPRALTLYERLIRTGAWWDVVDEVASHLVGPLLRAYPEVRPTVLSWAGADDVWLRRTAIICQLGAKQDTDLALLADSIDANLIDTVYGTEFFIRKGIGWALRQYAYIDPDWVREFVAQRHDRLSGLSRREALKHLTSGAPSAG